MMPEINTLPTRLRNILLGAGFGSGDEFVWISDYELQQINGIGDASVKLVRKAFGKSIVHRRVYEQCELLGMPLFEIVLPKVEGGWVSPVSRKVVNVEKAALNYFANGGWTGLDWEGQPLHILEDAASMSYRWNESGKATVSISRSYIGDTGITIAARSERSKYLNFWEWTESLGRKLDELIEPSVSIDETTLRENIHYYLRINRFEEFDHGKIVSFLINFWKLLGREKFREILRLRYKDNRFHYYSGWPDLALIRDNEYMFVEVKSIRDKFHWSQIKVFKDIAEQLSLPFFAAIVKPE